jgi:hypothetical protein
MGGGALPFQPINNNNNNNKKKNPKNQYVIICADVEGVPDPPLNFLESVHLVTKNDVMKYMESVEGSWKRHYTRRK